MPKGPSGNYVLPVEYVLDEYAANLQVAGIYVVGPLYPYLYTLFLKVQPKCQGYGLRNEQRIAGCKRGEAVLPELQNDGESEVLARQAVPFMVALPAARGLTSSRYY